MWWYFINCPTMTVQSLLPVTALPKGRFRYRSASGPNRDYGRSHVPRQGWRDAEGRAQGPQVRRWGGAFNVFIHRCVPRPGGYRDHDLEFLRSLALSSVLRSPVKRQQLITQWVHAARILLETMP